MGLLDLGKLITTVKSLPDSLPNRDIKQTVESVVKEIKILRAEKHELLSHCQELLHVIDEQSRRRNEMESKMEVNSQTGIPNHVRMEKDLSNYFNQKRYKDRPPTGALIILRLDKNFETIQRTIKPQMSEWILFQIGERIRTMFKGRNVYHLREGEFLVLTDGLNGAKDALKIARALHREISQPHIFTGYNVHIGCNIGITLFPENSLNKSYLLQSADIALQFAVDNEQTISVYKESMREKVVERMDLQNAIIRALEQQAIQEIDKQFDVFFQPILEIELEGDAIRVTRCFAEALIRWHHPKLGLVNPKMFIPLAEETGLIIPIGNWVLFHVARTMAEWTELGVHFDGVSINISPRQFRSDEVLENVLRILEQYRFPPHLLRLEITESTLIEEPMRIIQLMEELHSRGVGFSIDDFGTGYSSLAYVHRLPAGHLKIDQSFVRNLTTDPKSRAIIRTIIGMSHELGFKTIAEGVETREQLDFLYNDGVKTFQGFYFSKPLPADEFLVFLSVIENGYFRPELIEEAFTRKENGTGISPSFLRKATLHLEALLDNQPAQDLTEIPEIFP